MARYKKIDTRIWGDRKFRQLSPPKPCGQALWWRLMVPREATNIPGLFSTTESALAESLQWPLKGFRAAFAEISDQRMATADWKAGLVFLPNGIKFHKPESPNVIKSWRAPWDEVPECELKLIAYTILRGYVEKELSKAFLEAFDEAVPGVIPVGSVESSKKAVVESGAKAGSETGAGTCPLFHIGSGDQHSSSLKSDDDEFRNRIQSLIEILPNVKIRHVKEAHFQWLLDRKVSIEIVETACWVAIARKISKQGMSEPIASFSYFFPIIDEVSQSPLPNGYLEYVKGKVAEAVELRLAGDSETICSS
jgi:hypothetical protein